MLPIQQMIAPINKYSRPGKKIQAVKGIVMHWTATPGAPAKNIAKYFANLAKTGQTYASAHFAVDDNSIVQIIPENEIAYAVGSKTYTPEALKRLGSYPNATTISIEMCVDKNGNITEKTFQNAADLVAHLLKKYKLTVNDIWTHKGVVGWKDCPRPWVQKPSEFERFKQEVQKRLSGSVSTNTSQPTKTATGGVTQYVVKPGDTLWEIAKKFGVTVDDIVKANGIKNPSLIRVGQVLKIPCGFIEYVVKPGDSLWKIAKTYNTTVDEIVKVNGIKNPSLIRVGQVLKIPKR